MTRSHLTQRYGAGFLSADTTVQDWGVTYDDLEPHYDTFEYLCGTSGQAGNLEGKIQDGGNPFEGARSRPYPTPAMKQGYGHALFADAAKQLGYKPFPQPSGNLSEAYTNPLGVKLGQCTFCGSASGLAAPIIPRRLPRPRYSLCSCGNRISKHAPTASDAHSTSTPPANAPPA